MYPLAAQGFRMISETLSVVQFPVDSVYDLN